LSKTPFSGALRFREIIREINSAMRRFWGQFRRPDMPLRTRSTRPRRKVIEAEYFRHQSCHACCRRSSRKHERGRPQTLQLTVKLPVPARDAPRAIGAMALAVTCRRRKALRRAHRAAPWARWTDG
jgi:hypothetical protein